MTKIRISIKFRQGAIGWWKRGAGRIFQGVPADQELASVVSRIMKPERESVLCRNHSP